MKPHVVILSAFLSPLRSGAEACTEEVALRLSDRFDITILTARLRRSLPRRDMLGSRVPVLRLGFGHSIDKWLFPFLAPFAAREIKPQIVHAILESFAGLALVFCRWIVPRAKRILTCQSTNTTFLVGLMLRCADRITVISSVLRDRALAMGRADAVLIANGVDVRAIEEACGKYKKVPGRVLFVGRLEGMKGVDVLLKAFSSALTPSPFPSSLPVGSQHAGAEGSGGVGRGELHLYIVGDGSQRQKLEARAESLGIADRVTFMGRCVPAVVNRAYAEAEIFCGLSRSEALGNVFLEAQAAGCAVIATRVGGIPEIVSDGKTGLLVPPDDPEAAAEALKKLLSDEGIRVRLSANGRENARQYDWQGIAERYADVWRMVTGA
ncbi:MAG: glycosyltransferase family 4 protein [Candidatus Peregrinibacteria bacterium]